MANERVSFRNKTKDQDQKRQCTKKDKEPNWKENSFIQHKASSVFYYGHHKIPPILHL